MATKSLLAAKVRSFLTMLGIIIGVGAVILIISVGAGAQSLILNQIESLGTNMVAILPGASDEDAAPASAMGIAVTTLNYEDYEDLSDTALVPNVVGVVAYSKSVGAVSWRSISYDTSISGTTANYQLVEGGDLLEGRFFNKEEERNLSKVAVLGSTVKKELFGDSKAVGERIKIKKQSFEVIGVMKERGNVAFQNYDDQILVPIKTEQKLLSGVSHVSFVRAKINDPANIDQAIEDMKMVLRDNHDIIDQSGVDDDFSVRSGNDAIELIGTITDSLKYFLAMMAALSLLVGGIGIMNIMLVNVTERTREIGLRKAIGAKRSDIMVQFVAEAVTITLAGGIMGIISGAALAYLVAIIANYLGYEWDFVLSVTSILAGVIVSAGVGLFFGLYPANKASKLDPISALRYE
jgi:putative ABC transport system permease protein